jgi:hypothetical protein
MRNFEQLLDPRELTEHYVQAPSLTEYAFTDYFYKSPRPVDSDEVEMVYFTSGSEPAPLNTRGSEARLMSTAGGKKIKMHLFHSFNQVSLQGDALRALRNPNDESIQQKGEFAVTRVAEEFAERHRLQKEAVLAHTMSYHSVYFGQDGKLLIPSVHATTGVITAPTNPVVSADWEIPATHRGDLNSIISALWSSATNVDIPGHLVAIRRAAVRARLPIPKNIWLNAINKPYILNNDYYEQYAIQNPAANQKFLEGYDVIEGLWGHNWRFFEGTYEIGGTTYDIIPSTVAIMFPDFGPWVKPLAGAELVPSSLEIKNSPQEALASLIKTYGQFAYAQLEHNPVKLNLYMGDNYGLNFAEPLAIWTPTVFTAAS